MEPTYAHHKLYTYRLRGTQNYVLYYSPIGTTREPPYRYYFFRKSDDKTWRFDRRNTFYSQIDSTRILRSPKWFSRLRKVFKFDLLLSAILSAEIWKLISASKVLGDLLTQGVKKYFVAVFTTRSRIEALSPVKSAIDFLNGQNPVFVLDEDATENDPVPEKIFWTVQNFKIHFTRTDNLMDVVNGYNNQFCPTHAPPRSITPKIDDDCVSMFAPSTRYV